MILRSELIIVDVVACLRFFHFAEAQQLRHAAQMMIMLNSETLKLGFGKMRSNLLWRGVASVHLFEFVNQGLLLICRLLRMLAEVVEIGT